MDDSSHVKTIDRLVRLLDCFTLDRPAWSLAELAAELGLPKSTLHRFLTGLEAHRILRRDESDRRWRVGYRLLIWGSIAGESTPLAEIAGPVMRKLMAASGETALLTMYQDHGVVCIAKCDTLHPVRLALGVGTRREAHAGASSKVLMAHLPEAETRALVRDRGLRKVCTNTITDPAELHAELARIREQGYAVSLEETDPGAWGVATPIRDWRGQVVAAIGVAGPTTRYSDAVVQRTVALCRQAADEITALIGAGSEAKQA